MLTVSLKTTPLHQAHVAAGARMVPFAGYDMPVQFADGVLTEHRWTREHAGVFDVSHMGPLFLRLKDPTGDPAADHLTLADALEPVVSADVRGLAPGRLRYAVLLNETGGMLDDLMIGRPIAAPAALYLVVNGAVKEADIALLTEALGQGVVIERADENALLAIQGPEAGDVVDEILPGASALRFMDLKAFRYDDFEILASRSGYTGEDGFEILVPGRAAPGVYARLLSDPRVRPIGLGARDSLRLEAGLPLYGHDADEGVSPIEAGLGFAVSKKRLGSGAVRGSDRLARELAGDLNRVRTALLVGKGAPAREGAELRDGSGTPVGRVTSGGFSPSLGVSIAMGFVPPHLATPGTRLTVMIRDRAQDVEVVSFPFVPHRYVRKP
jgi:aminomethyltransferase